jgi:hypothetical protein
LLENQSELESVGVSQSEHKEQNIVFHDADESWAVNIPSEPDPSFDVGVENDATLADFLSRPVIVHQSGWATTDPAFADGFNPWQQFLEYPSIQRKISNYFNLRCKLRLKFLINGNSFYFGRAVCCYTPIHGLSSQPLPRGAFTADLVRATSRPHIFLDPSTSQGGEMTLPFFFYNNAVNLVEKEYNELGYIDLLQITRLKHANGAAGDVRITVMAWAEDVVLNVPTVYRPGPVVLENQAEDEYAKPSVIASTAAKIADVVSKVPTLMPYARASSMVLNGMSEMFKLFGYSRPVITDTTLVRSQFLGNMANTNVCDTSFKLSTDVKQEITIDPRTVGLGSVDEMAISHIAGKSAWLYQFNWNTTNNYSDRLTSLGVTPYVWHPYIANSEEFFCFPPCMHVASCFRYWRGTMKYRFQIVASNFHRGRLLVVYDPHNVDSFDPTSTYSRVIDISRDRDFTIEVGWGTNKPYKDSLNPALNTNGLVWRSGNAVLPTDHNHYNGMLGVYVLNDLVVPNSTADNNVQINVYISTGDDIEFQAPSDNVPRTFMMNQRREFSLENQAEEIAPQDGDLTMQPSRPDGTQVTSLINAPAQIENRSADVCFGERIVSMRALLKRYFLYEAFRTPISTTDGYVILKRQSTSFPKLRGHDDFGIHRTTLDLPYNYNNDSFLSWMSWGYVGRRGGIRHKFTTAYASNGSKNWGQSVAEVMREAPSNSNIISAQQIGSIQATTSTNSRLAHAAAKEMLSMGYGGIFAASSVQPTIECENPYYQNKRFNLAQSYRQVESTYRYQLGYVRNSEGEPLVFHHMAAADDFSLFFYIGPPPCVYAPTDPDPIPTNP